ncbi:hypothetical protein L3X38_038478 [Prunus dulcis]|uniref:RNase H type-1 domain-containing protein n=1 Tax=Prunus dulcis TaxID=3755 RepID=A0AAD4V5E1_PRUDU|nr:hypothetical protein L3X38_038478 [Prunus dulcis]
MAIPIIYGLILGYLNMTLGILGPLVLCPYMLQIRAFISSRDAQAIMAIPRDAQAIMAIPISNLDLPDRLIWPHTVNGRYSVKFGYYYLMEHKKESASDGVVMRDHTGILLDGITHCFQSLSAVQAECHAIRSGLEMAYVRGFHNNLLDGITHCFQSLSAVQAECHAIRSGLEMAYVRGFTNVIVETDFKVCFAAVQEDISVSKWTLYPILYDIRMLKVSFSSLRWAWTTRDANHAADWVASQARRGLCAEAWVIRPPTALVYILSRDGLPCPPN